MHRQDALSYLEIVSHAKIYSLGVEAKLYWWYVEMWQTWFVLQLREEIIILNVIAFFLGKGSEEIFDLGKSFYLGLLDLFGLLLHLDFLILLFKLLCEDEALLLLDKLVLIGILHGDLPRDPRRWLH